LGPPKNPDVLREMEPPAAESFLRASPAPDQLNASLPSAFDDVFAVTRADYDEQTGKTLAADFPVTSEARLADVMDEPAMELLTRLEEAVNSTSLVLLFNVGNEWMLFPGDAQWGTWKAILNDTAHTKLLEQLSFYKVGHHGSHNATPISFVDRFMKAGTLAMLPYGKVEKWPSIPRAGLLERLQKQQVILARADEAPPNAFTSQQKDGEVLTIDVSIAS
jgi:hypothetical protein